MDQATIVAVGSRQAWREWVSSGGYLYVVEGRGGAVLLCSEVCRICVRRGDELLRCSRHLAADFVAVPLVLVD